MYLGRANNTHTKESFHEKLTYNNYINSTQYLNISYWMILVKELSTVTNWNSAGGNILTDIYI